LEAVDCCDETEAAGTDGKSFAKGAETENTASKRGWKPNARYFSGGYETWFGKRKASVASSGRHLKKTSASKGEDGCKRKGRLSNQDTAEGSGNKVPTTQ